MLYSQYTKIPKGELKRDCLIPGSPLEIILYRIQRNNGYEYWTTDNGRQKLHLSFTQSLSLYVGL